MGRLNKDNQAAVQPERMKHAQDKITALGFEIVNLGQSDNLILFYFKDKAVYFFPFTGWHSGKSITAGRGLQNLLKQLK